MKKEPGIYMHIIVFLVSLATPVFLYFTRHLDDNRLTSWSWAFASANLSLLLGPLVAALLLAWLLSRVRFYERARGVALFAVSFALASCFWTEPEVVVDAGRYFTQAKQLQLHGVRFFVEEWGGSVFAWTDMPLVPFLYGLVFKFFGEQRFFVQFLNTTFYSLAVVLTYQLGKSLWDEEMGFRGGVLLLGFPYLYTQVPLMLVDVATMFFFALATVSCVRALKYGGAGRMATASLALFFLFYAKYSSWVLLASVPVICLFFMVQNPLEATRRTGALALLSILLIGALFLVYRDIFLDQIDFLVTYQKPGLKSWSESHVSSFLFQVHPFVSGAAFIAFFAAVRKVDFRFVIISVAVLLFLAMGVKRVRYLLPLFPMIALMASYGTESLIRSRSIKNHLFFSVAATSFVIGFFGFLPLLKTFGVGNLQKSGRYLQGLAAENVEVLSFAGENVVVNPAMAVVFLDIYTTKNLIYDHGPAGNELTEQQRTSSLRFTWEFPLPDYYSPGSLAGKADALVVISSDPDLKIPPDTAKKISTYPLQKTFRASSNIFLHQTYVTVYHK
jgi:hypothetical protein